MTLAMVPYRYLCDLDRGSCEIQAQVHEKPGQRRSPCLQLSQRAVYPRGWRVTNSSVKTLAGAVISDLKE